jgi:hypothetical protein
MKHNKDIRLEGSSPEPSSTGHESRELDMYNKRPEINVKGKVVPVLN